MLLKPGMTPPATPAPAAPAPVAIAPAPSLPGAGQKRTDKADRKDRDFDKEARGKTRMNAIIAGWTSPVTVAMVSKEDQKKMAHEIAEDIMAYVFPDDAHS